MKEGAKMQIFCEALQNFLGPGASLLTPVCSIDDSVFH